MTETNAFVSLPGFPAKLAGKTRYDGADLALEDGDLAIRDGALALVHGAQALGQSLAIGLGELTLDLQLHPAEYQNVRQEMDIVQQPRPTVDHGSPDWLMQSTAQTRWDEFHTLGPNECDWFVPDMRGASLEERIQRALRDIDEYLVAVHDVRFNGADVEIDFEPVGYEPHVLRINDLAKSNDHAVDGASGPRWRACTPLRRDDLLVVQTLNTRLLRHLHSHPELLRELHWRRFEELVAELLSKEGWDVQLTRGSKDGGVDIYASRKNTFGTTLAVVDCKQYSDPIGVGLVRAIAGLRAQHNADVGVLITTSHFTKPARALEENQLRRQVSLKDFGDLKTWLQRHDWSEAANGVIAPSTFLERK